MVTKDLDVTRDEMLAELVKVVVDQEPPGVGWFTIAEVAKASSMPYERMKRRLHRKVEQGLLDTWKNSVNRRVYFREVVKDD